MNNKFFYIFSITLLFTSCHAGEFNKNSYHETPISSNQISKKLTNPSRCVRSEGGYETNQYCILVINKPMPLTYDDKPPTVKIFIKNKRTGNTEVINGKHWWSTDDDMYGFKGKSRDKVYEIDWRKEKTHFRIWDASHKKLLEDELVIVGPEDILKDKSANP